MVPPRRQGTPNALSLSLILNTAASAASPWEDVVDIDPATHALAKVTMIDGSYTLIDPMDTPIGEQRVDGALTWEYMGQWVYTDAPIDPASIRLTKTNPDGTDTRTTEERLLATYSVDAFGREWRVVAVDVEAIDAAAAMSFDKDPEARIPDEELPKYEDDPNDESVTNLAWTVTDCDNDGVDDLAYSDNSDDRVTITQPLSCRQKKVVIVAATLAGNPPFLTGCSGVLVDEEYVLTAAHCVTNDGNGTPAMVNGVCPFGNSANYTTDATICQTIGINGIILTGDYPGANNGNMQDDYALLKLGTALGTGKMGVDYGYMLFSHASDGTIDNFPAHALGYPRRAAVGTNDCALPNSTLTADAAFTTPGGNLQMRSDGDITGWTTSGRVKTNLDVSGGNSGGPLYYCADAAGCTSCSQTERISGIMSGFVGWPATYTGGPKVAKFRDWAEGVLPNQ